MNKTILALQAELDNLRSERDAEQSEKRRLLHAAIMAYSRLKEVYDQPEIPPDWPEELATLGQIIEDTKLSDLEYTED